MAVVCLRLLQKKEELVQDEEERRPRHSVKQNSREKKKKTKTGTARGKADTSPIWTRINYFCLTDPSAEMDSTQENSFSLVLYK